MIEQIYTPGKIVEFSWGYDQTNVDFYLITRRSGDFVTLLPIGKKNEYNPATMTGTTTPDPSQPLNKKPFRRKVHTSREEEIGVAIESYGWASLWNGKPSRYSNYR